jgi:hypothetical protein
MAYNIDFSGKDWNGRPLISAGNALNLTSLTGEYKYFFIDGDKDAADNFTNEYQLRGIWIYGSITSPSSWRSTATAADTTLFLHLDFFQRGEDFNSYLATTIDTHIPLIHFRASETSTTKTLDPIYINLNTSGKVVGNAMVRLAEGSYDDLAGGTANAWSNADISVNKVYGTEASDLYDNLITLEAQKSTAGADATNNLLATGSIGVANRTATTSEQIPANTAGYIQATFNPFGKYGNINNGPLEFGMTDSADAATTTAPKYRWVLTSSNVGSHTGYAVHDGTTVVASQAIQLGDVFKVQRDASGNYTYYKNGVSQGTGGTTNTGAMLGDFYLYTGNYNRLLNIRADIGAGEISPTFTNLVNVSTDY